MMAVAVCTREGHALCTGQSHGLTLMPIGMIKASAVPSQQSALLRSDVLRQAQASPLRPPVGHSVFIITAATAPPARSVYTAGWLLRQMRWPLWLQHPLLWLVPVLLLPQIHQHWGRPGQRQHARRALCPPRRRRLAGRSGHAAAWAATMCTVLLRPAWRVRCKAGAGLSTGRCGWAARLVCLARSAVCHVPMCILSGVTCHASEKPCTGSPLHLPVQHACIICLGPLAAAQPRSCTQTLTAGRHRTQW